MRFERKTDADSCRSVERSALLVLLRHAQTDVHGRFCGFLDPALSAVGRKQIPAVIQRLSAMKPSRIWCSDLRRAEETVVPIAKYFGMTYRTSPSLREMNFGSWEGLTWEEVKSQFPDDSLAWRKSFPHHRPPRGESFREFRSRVIAELERLSAADKPGCTLVVTHAGFIRAAIGWVLAIPDDSIVRIGQDYGAITTLQKNRGHWTLTAMNNLNFPIATCIPGED